MLTQFLMFIIFRNFVCRWVLIIPTYKEILIILYLYVREECDYQCELP